mmetsp:Transcript_151180/g.485665  ORF Transcript_151180/g.485665 Transcript_151180/m.485665 type:complete len:235 (+) Transcript_151180:669-1373(+)
MSRICCPTWPRRCASSSRRTRSMASSLGRRSSRACSRKTSSSRLRSQIFGLTRGLLLHPWSSRTSSRATPRQWCQQTTMAMCCRRRKCPQSLQTRSAWSRPWPPCTAPTAARSSGSPPSARTTQSPWISCIAPPTSAWRTTVSAGSRAGMHSPSQERSYPLLRARMPSWRAWRSSSSCTFLRSWARTSPCGSPVARLSGFATRSPRARRSCSPARCLRRTKVASCAVRERPESW